MSDIDIALVDSLKALDHGCLEQRPCHLQCMSVSGLGADVVSGRLIGGDEASPLKRLNKACAINNQHARLALPHAADDLSLARRDYRATGKPWVLAIDRTNWDFGKTTIDILLISMTWNGMGIPLLSMVLPTAGNSNTSERAELLEFSSGESRSLSDA